MLAVCGRFDSFLFAALFFELPTTCITHSFMWMYYIEASARNADFGDLRPLLRPLLNLTGTVQLRRRKGMAGCRPTCISSTMLRNYSHTSPKDSTFLGW